MVDRGAIRNREFSNQVKDYTGLRYGKITPTDIDGMIEYKNLCYVYIEIKTNGAEMPQGQKLALERQCDDMQKVKPAVLILVSHSGIGDIDVANTIVSEYRYGSKWNKPGKPITAKEFIDSFFSTIERKPVEAQPKGEPPVDLPYLEMARRFVEDQQ